MRLIEVTNHEVDLGKIIGRHMAEVGAK